MAITTGDSVFRPFLRDDMLSAWGLVQVHYDAPAVPGSLDILPRGFIELQDIAPGAGHSFTRRLLLHQYRLVGQFSEPENETQEEARLERVGELLDVLTAGNTAFHNDYRYRDVGVPIAEARQLDDAMEDVYHVVIDITLEWETGV